MLKRSIKLLKFLKWDLSTKAGRFYYLYFFIRYLPGRFGEKLRSLLFKKYIGSVGDNLTVHEGVRVRNIDKLIIGNNVMLGVNNFIQAAGGVDIGNDVMLAPDVKIWSVNHIFDDPDKPVIEQGYECRKVIIGNNVWVGSNVFIMPGAELGYGVIISAGAVVGAKKIPPYTIMAGSPARKIGERKKLSNDANEVS